MPNILTKALIKRAKAIVARSKKYHNYSKARKARIAFKVAWKIKRAQKRK